MIKKYIFKFHPLSVFGRTEQLKNISQLGKNMGSEKEIECETLIYNADNFEV